MNWWDTHGSEIHGIDTSLILVMLFVPYMFATNDWCNQAQAQSLDTLQLSDVVDTNPRTRSLLQRLLSMDRETFLAKAGWEDVSVRDISAIAHTLARLDILDHFVDAVAFPRHPTLALMEKIQFPQRFPERLDRVCCFPYRLHSSDIQFSDNVALQKLVGSNRRLLASSSNQWFAVQEVDFSLVEDRRRDTSSTSCISSSTRNPQRYLNSLARFPACEHLSTSHHSCKH
jgi:hypothetical protein